jgi:2-polyprenyl-3-methyl-5-hydroxy-6-metoxy-1,4-benzoquinol methylase
MKKELKEDWYDNAYKGAVKYDVHYTKSPYYKIWVYIASIIDKGADVLDLGCGTGQFANLLIDNNIKYSYGIDFSKTAIDLAKKVVDCNFYVADLYNKETYNLHDYNTVICLEVLEHIEDDLSVLKSIKEGSNIIISVPNYDSKSHVRHFESIDSVIARYKDSFNIEGFKTFDVSVKNKIFVLYGNNK